MALDVLFMRLSLLFAAILTACTVAEPLPTPSSPRPAQTPAANRSPQQAVDAYLRVGRQIEGVAEQVCRQKNPRAPRAYCDFQLKVDASETNVPNAFQTIGSDGRPIIAFNIPMLATVRNDHEIAFILGHEAGHQIANHIVRATTNANIGAIVLGGLLAATGADQASVAEAQNIGGAIGARAYSQSHELEADVLGTYIAAIAGYDPAVGSLSFSRFGGGPSFLSTHPPSQQRIATVQRTIQKIRQDRAEGRPIRVP